jgi:hypothetical protein
VEIHMAVPTHTAARTRTAPTMDNNLFVSQDLV